MLKRFADKDQTKCSSKDGNSQTWADCAQKLYQASSLEGNLIYKNPLIYKTVTTFDPRTDYR